MVFSVTSFTGRENLCSEKGSSVSRLHIAELVQIVSQVLSQLADSFSVPILQMVRQTGFD